ncbi:hypothetical protein AAU57_07695 [Nonlabens sp. YIK11]|uniref:carboxypeptidase-like regulatory domain-containing protein n=1 Tax=Nonlabens sp. YIK11 TaxID=1453349 RepID=UPI0006DC62EC|nr:carboxypeptidase-like regulatory domain-containing protein [Nonlabens sp. YIK11]KQC33208.1 hypothetical protein AAU57_07695 [Nonlabens sp. YIK11]
MNLSNDRIWHLSLVLTLFFSQLVVSQNKMYSGVVLENNTPILGATVVVKGTSISTKTDFDGKFNIIVPKSSKILIFSYSGYETVERTLDQETFINVEMHTYREKGIWVSVGGFSDLTFAPYGIAISNGQQEQKLLHFESFQERVSLRLAVATDFSENWTYESKFIYHPPILNNSLSNTSIAYIKKDYQEFKFEDCFLSTNVTKLNFINAMLTAKVGVQRFDRKQGFGGAIGFESGNYNLRFQYGAQIGYWNDYFTYEIYFRKFLIEDSLSLITNYDRINNVNFLKVGINFLFKTHADKY